jgi:hypothetical protein
VNQLIIHLARIDTCSVCNNDRELQVCIPGKLADGIVPCPLCSGTQGLAAWLIPFLEARTA